MSEVVFDKQKLIFYFSAADEILREMGRSLAVYVCGGANMCMYYPERPATRDIDTSPSDEALLWRLSEVMQKRFSLPASWINHSATLFIAKPMEEEAELRFNFNSLKVYFLNWKAMFVLKVVAGREGTYDFSDAVAIAKTHGLTDVNEAAAMVDYYMPGWGNAFVTDFARRVIESANLPHN